MKLTSFTALALPVISCIGAFPHLAASGIVVRKHEGREQPREEPALDYKRLPRDEPALDLKHLPRDEPALEYNQLRQSVLRVQASFADFDWLHPFVPSVENMGIGSAFVVQTEPYPLFVTNAHVITDASYVGLQLLLYGNHEWEAQVVSVCSKFDLALLVLKDSKAFTQALAERQIALQPLKLAAGSVSMGDDVIALGFPLGHNSLKISKGNIAGFEHVDDNVCIQSTAPISPGSSGGPLLDRLGQQVVGVNFAKATEGENINYVIPAWRVSQMVAHHLKQQPHGQEAGVWKRLPVQIPPHDLSIIEANYALRLMSGGCDRGVYISKVGKRSFFNHAKPPVPGSFFLVGVNGKELDRFGTGLEATYIADRVDFLDLFYMVEDISAEVEVQTCFQGKTTTHRVSLEWLPEYERGVRFVNEPYHSGASSAYEIFGDMSVMEMTVNHISEVLNQIGDPGPARWLHPDLVSEPRLVINYVRQGSYASGVTRVGSTITNLNGHPVRTLEEFRRHFVPDGAENVWTLETDMGQLVAVMFNESLADQLHEATVMDNPYLRTRGVVAAAQAMGIDVHGYAVGAGSNGTKHMDEILREPTAHQPDAQFAKEVNGLQAWGTNSSAPPSLPGSASAGLNASSRIAGATSAAIVAAAPAAKVPAGPRVRAAGPLGVQPSEGRRGRFTGKATSTVWHLPRV